MPTFLNTLSQPSTLQPGLNLAAGLAACLPIHPSTFQLFNRPNILSFPSRNFQFSTILLFPSHIFQPFNFSTSQAFYLPFSHFSTSHLFSKTATTLPFPSHTFQHFNFSASQTSYFSFLTRSNLSTFQPANHPTPPFSHFSTFQLFNQPSILSFSSNSFQPFNFFNQPSFSTF